MTTYVRQSPCRCDEKSESSLPNAMTRLWLRMLRSRLCYSESCICDTKIVAFTSFNVCTSTFQQPLITAPSQLITLSHAQLSTCATIDHDARIRLDIHYGNGVLLTCTLEALDHKVWCCSGCASRTCSKWRRHSGHDVH
jgi:hypothetical protein